ncbi:hypothetical protein [Pseudoteredinibacter isoporae]|uniref:hypothetical protein n=1 Tax=Pseudoteredinibacter isoporae TaxID=570281 RepID=UPI0031075BA3
MNRFIFLCMTLLCSISLNVSSAVDDSIRVSLEEPVSATPHSGVSNLRGWAIDKSGIDRIELFIDDKYVADIPYGGIRTDVGDAYPDYQNSEHSGFSMAYNYNALKAGTHTARVRAYNLVGDHRDSTVSFSVAPISEKFLNNSGAVVLNNGSTISASSGNSLTVQGAMVDGKALDIELRWNPATQGFGIQKVEPSSSEPDYVISASGSWRITELGNRFLVQFYTTPRNNDIYASAAFLDLNERSFQAGEGKAVNKKALVLNIDDDAITAQYSITFSSSTQASIYVVSCQAKAGFVCLRNAGETLNMVKVI